jgi:hypothetical protein
MTEKKIDGDGGENFSRERFEDGDEIYVVVFRLNYVVF